MPEYTRNRSPGDCRRTLYDTIRKNLQRTTQQHNTASNLAHRVNRRIKSPMVVPSNQFDAAPKWVTIHGMAAGEDSAPNKWEDYERMCRYATVLFGGSAPIHTTLSFYRRSHATLPDVQLRVWVGGVLSLVAAVQGSQLLYMCV